MTASCHQFSVLRVRNTLALRGEQLSKGCFPQDGTTGGLRHLLAPAVLVEPVKINDIGVVYAAAAVRFLPVEKVLFEKGPLSPSEVPVACRGVSLFKGIVLGFGQEKLTQPGLVPSQVLQVPASFW